MKWIVVACVVALAIARAFSPQAVDAQEPRDPLIIPQEGGRGSRFQIVGQVGWTPGAEVKIRLAYDAAGVGDPLAYGGPFPVEFMATVLRDGTWSFPIVLTDDLFGAPLASPGFVIVKAESGARAAQNAYVYSPDGLRPAGADRVAALGFGLPGGPPVFALTLALFALGAGGLIVMSGAGRVLSSRR